MGPHLSSAQFGVHGQWEMPVGWGQCLMEAAEWERVEKAEDMHGGTGRTQYRGRTPSSRLGDGQWL